MVEVDVAVRLEAHADDKVSLGQKGTESGEISEAERGVGQLVVFSK